MQYLATAFLGLILAATQTRAHFTLDYPTSLGFDDDTEGTGPCGGVAINLTAPSNFYVGGDAIALTSSHAASHWLYRATLDPNAAGNWTTLLPVVAQTGLGAFCERAVMAPAAWVGQKGYLQVIQGATDGALYQCAPVSFIAGANPSTPSKCTNATAVSATYTTDAALVSIAAASSVPAAASSTTPGASTPTPTKSAAIAVVGGEGVWQGLFWSMIVLFGSAVLALY